MDGSAKLFERLSTLVSLALSGRDEATMTVFICKVDPVLTDKVPSGLQRSKRSAPKGGNLFN